MKKPNTLRIDLKLLIALQILVAALLQPVPTGAAVGITASFGQPSAAWTPPRLASETAAPLALDSPLARRESTFLSPAGGETAGRLLKELPCRHLAVQEGFSRQMAEEVALGSTVRIHVSRWRVMPDESGYEIDDKVAHATIVGDRFLVTHNHFSFRLGHRLENYDYSSFGVRTLSGQQVIILPLSAVSIIAEDDQTLVLDLGDEGAAALQSATGRQPATLALCRPNDIGPGAQVAQIDWDGKQTRVDWTTVVATPVAGGVTKLVLADGLQPGASGGGIFVGGCLAANNWTSVQMFDEKGNVARELSTAALNSLRMLADLQRRNVPVCGRVSAPY